MSLPHIFPNWHPIFVHFPIALLTTAALLFALGTLLSEHPAGIAATVAARWNLGIGAAVSLAALASGWQAYNTVIHDDAGHANMTVHMRWAFTAAGLFLAAAAFAWLDRRRRCGAGPALGGALVLGFVALVVTGWLGGENVYRYGIGVESLPNAAHHHHDDGDHGDEHGAAGDSIGPRTPASRPAANLDGTSGAPR